MLLVCGTLGLGRLVWWLDAPWLGWMLCAAILLLLTAFHVELRRANPLIRFEWIGTREILRFAAVALVMRLALAEQTYGAVGLLTSGGLTNDQLRVLFTFVILGMILGVLSAVLTLSEERLPYQVIVAALVIAAGAWLDSRASNLTRPPQLYFSQALIGFGTTLFIGPTLTYGMLRVLRRGPDVLVSLVVLFSITQNVGGLAGSALLGTFQTIAARAHAAALSERLMAGDPQVAARLQAGAGALSGALLDADARAAQGGGLLARAMTAEANVLAYNDVFRAVAVLALTTVSYVALALILKAIRRSPPVTVRVAT
jgi:hypothetical protein